MVTDIQTPEVSPGNYSPVIVEVKEATGTVFLGILSIILLIGWMRSEARNYTLIAEPGRTNGNNQLQAG